VASVTQLHLRHYQSHYHVSIWMTVIYRSRGNNHTSLDHISFHHASMHVVVKEKYMLLWITFILSVNHVAPVRHTIHVCTRFLLRTRHSHLRFFTIARRRAKALLSMGASIELPTRTINDSVTLFLPTVRGRWWFLLTPTLSLQPWFFLTRASL
jgi:hypothetical protein